MGALREGAPSLLMGQTRQGTNMGLRIYVGVQMLTLTFALWWSVERDGGSSGPAWTVILLVALLAGTEAVSLFFHGKNAGRISLSTAEAILLPMLVVLSFPQFVWGAAIANAFARLPRWRIAAFKETFNVAQYGVAAFLAALVWRALYDGSVSLSARNAAAAALAMVVFQLGTHLFVAIAIALASREPLLKVSASVAPATLVNLAASIMVGLILTSSYLTAPWTAVLFPVLLGGLYLGYRAILQQSRERERVESLYSGTRALASSPDIDEALVGFLRAIADIASATEGRAYVMEGNQVVMSAVRDGVAVSRLQSAPEALLRDILIELDRSGGSLVVSEDTTGPWRKLAAAIGVRSLVAVPLLVNDNSVGALIAADRIGAGEFGDADTRLLEALAAELTVSLDSHRLFAEVAEERERFGRIFHGSKEGICLIDGAGVVQAWNPALERITGHPASSVMGKVWSDAVVIRDRTENRLTGDELVGAEPDEELELVTKSGPSRWITTLAGPVGETENAGWVVLVRDVTAEHEVETAKSDFLSTISHELRTPLTTIKGSLQVLGRGREALPPQLADQMIGVTTRGAERLERLVMNLLAVSQIESGTMSVFPDEVSLDALVREKAESMLQGHERFVIEGGDGPLVVRADRERVGHAVEHLIENALKFGGPQGEIRISITRDNGYGRVSVSDEGPGIPAGDRERIFERFVRLGDVLTRETQGAGVGLFIAVRSIEAMGGRVWVDSEVGKGSTFHLTVPLARPMAVEDQADTA